MASISQTMKIVDRCSVALFLWSAATSSVLAGEFKSQIVTDSPLVIVVPDDRFLKVTNFTQEGGIDRGVLRVTLNSETETGQAANVLTASRIDLSTGAASQNPPEAVNQVIIAGPAHVRVQPVAGATLFITYRKEPKEGGGGTSTTVVVVSPTPASPTPGLTVTPTIPPIPIPTP